MTQEKESRVERYALLFDQLVLVFMHPAEAKRVTIQDSPSGSTVDWDCENRGETQASFWCSAWVGNLNTKMHSIDSWPCKRFFNSLLFCFHLVWVFFPLFLFSELFRILWIRGNGPGGWSSFYMRFYFWPERKGSTGLHFCLLFFFIFSVFLICQWLMVVVWTLIQNTDHDFKGWTKSLLRNSFVLTWGMSISVDVLLYIGVNCSVKFVYWVLIILLTIVDFERKA